MRNNTYRGHGFYQAACQLDIEIVPGINMHPDLADYWQVALPLQFSDPDQATQTIVEFAQKKPVQAILAVDDSAAVIAAQASERLGLPHNSAESAVAARNKYHMRRLFAAAGVPSPQFKLYDMSADPTQITTDITYPCVLKPLLLNGSRGVIRANNPTEFAEAFNWVRRMLTTMERSPGSTQILVEDFIPGFEVALEGIIDQAQLKVLALFDKPDPLDGPFFEETIYVTPSRLSLQTQNAIADCAAQAAQALGLRHGPLHAELRINENGPWMVEIAGRSIGGLCSQTLNFGLEGLSLETLILRQAVGLEIDSLTRETQARGVMMIPIPSAGIYQGLSGLEAAEAVPGIESLEITAKVNYPLIPLPEGESYLGFIFATGSTPEMVEAALREAYQQLHFKIDPMLPLAIG